MDSCACFGVYGDILTAIFFACFIEASQPPASPSAAASNVSGAIPASESGPAGACGASTQVACVKPLLPFFFGESLVLDIMQS